MKKQLPISPLMDLRQAHASLLEDLRKLEEVARPPSGKMGTDLPACLAATKAHVTEHFQFEEQDGYFEAVRKREPRLERTIQQLAVEHRQMAEALDGLILEAKAALPDEPFRKKIMEWVKWVRDHEARENRLAQEAFNQDSGEED